MLNRIKRFLSLTLTVLMLINMLPVNALADTTVSQSTSFAGQYVKAASVDDSDSNGITQSNGTFTIPVYFYDVDNPSTLTGNTELTLSSGNNTRLNNNDTITGVLSSLKGNNPAFKIADSASSSGTSVTQLHATRDWNTDKWAWTYNLRGSASGSTINYDGKNLYVGYTSTLPKITVSPASEQIDSGETVTLTATVKNAGNNPTVVWTSSNSAVADVVVADNTLSATVTGNSGGVAEITAQISGADNEAATTTSVITVYKDAQSVTIMRGGSEAPVEINIESGAQDDVIANLTAAVSPDDASASAKVVTWSTSNPLVASVTSTGDNSVAVKYGKRTSGTAVITATLPNGEKDTFTINVVSFGMDVEPANVDMFTGDVYFFYPSVTALDDAWVVEATVLEGEDVIEITQPDKNSDNESVVRALQAGTATVNFSLYRTDANGKKTGAAVNPKTVTINVIESNSDSNHTVSFYDADGVLFTTYSVEDNGAVTVPSDGYSRTMEGHKFLGFMDIQDPKATPDYHAAGAQITGITEDKVYVAKFEAVRIQVRFHLSEKDNVSTETNTGYYAGGEVGATVTRDVEWGAVVDNKPQDPTPRDVIQKFVGWVDENGKAFDFWGAIKVDIAANPDADVYYVDVYADYEDITISVVRTTFAGQYGDRVKYSVRELLESASEREGVVLPGANTLKNNRFAQKTVYVDGSSATYSNLNEYTYTTSYSTENVTYKKTSFCRGWQVVGTTTLLNSYDTGNFLIGPTLNDGDMIFTEANILAAAQIKDSNKQVIGYKDVLIGAIYEPEVNFSQAHREHQSDMVTVTVEVVTEDGVYLGSGTVDVKVGPRYGYPSVYNGPNDTYNGYNISNVIPTTAKFGQVNLNGKEVTLTTGTQKDKSYTIIGGADGNLNIDNLEVVWLCQKAEHVYGATNAGGEDCGGGCWQALGVATVVVSVPVVEGVRLRVNYYNVPWNEEENKEGEIGDAVHMKTLVFGDDEGELKADDYLNFANYIDQNIVANYDWWDYQWVRGEENALAKKGETYVLNLYYTNWPHYLTIHYKDASKAGTDNEYMLDSQLEGGDNGNGDIIEAENIYKKLYYRNNLYSVTIPTAENYEVDARYKNGAVVGTMPSGMRDITVWYYPTVTINYKAMVDDGKGNITEATTTKGGKVAPTSETVRLIDDSPIGSTPLAYADYEFVGWYTDEACKTAVTATDGTVGAGNNFVPKAGDDGRYTKGTYYALFRLAKGTLTINKTVDDDKFSGKKTFSFTVSGTVDGETISESVDILVTEANMAFSGTITLPYGSYTVTETTDSQGNYAVAYSPAASATLNAENKTATVSVTNTQEYALIHVEKRWVDGDDVQGFRPSSIVLVVTGMVDGKVVAELGKTITVKASDEAVTGSEADEWSFYLADYANLPLYYEGKPVTYTVTEIKPERYNKEESGNAAEGYVITNTVDNIDGTVEVQATKEWNDPGQNKDRPGNGQFKITLTPSDATKKIGNAAASGKTFSFTVWTASDLSNDENIWHSTDKYNLPLFYDDGTPITYTVKEDLGNGATKKFSYTTSGKGDNDYSTYTPALKGDDHSVDLVNTATTRDITVTKDWVDNENQDGIRPPSVTVRLMNGKTEVKTATLNDSNNWKHTWTDISLYDSNKVEIQYSVVEDTLNGYTCNVTGDALTGFTVTNTHTPETVSVSVSKAWSDNENQDGDRPGSVKVQLYADNDAYGDPVELNSGNGWAHTWNNLAKNAMGTAIPYKVVEIKVGEKTLAESDYTATYEPAKIVGADGTIKVTNEKKESSYDKTSFTVTKTWSDEEDKFGMRPTSVKVQLYANGSVYGDPVELNASNSWTYTWNNLDKNSAGTPINYTVDETAVPSGYTKSVDGGTITNTLDVGTLTINKKVVDDAKKFTEANPSGKTFSFTVSGTANGKTITKTVDINVNEVNKDFTNTITLPYGSYTVTETTDSQGDYAVAYSPAASATLNAENKTAAVSVTNTKEYASLTVNKIWKTVEEKKTDVVIKVMRAAGDDEATEYATIKFSKTAEGDTSGPDYVVNGNTWSKTLTDLPVYDKDKNFYIYSIEEQPDFATKSEYDVTYTPATKSVDLKDGDATLSVTNNLEQVEVSVSGSKVWYDLDEKHRATIRLERSTDGKNWAQAKYDDDNDTPVADATVSNANANFSFTGLPKYDRSTETTTGEYLVWQYRVVEVEPDKKYTVIYSTTNTTESGAVTFTDNAATGVTVTNILNQKNDMDVYFAKEWKDDASSANRDTISVALTSSANGKKDIVSVDSVQLNKNNYPTTGTGYWSDFDGDSTVPDTSFLDQPRYVYLVDGKYVTDPKADDLPNVTGIYAITYGVEETLPTDSKYQSAAAVSNDAVNTNTTVGDTVKEFLITNTIKGVDKTITVVKNWVIPETDYNNKVYATTFELQRKGADGIWAKYEKIGVANPITLTKGVLASDSWTVESYDENGNTYDYRVVETKVEGFDTAATANGAALTNESTDETKYIVDADKMDGSKITSDNNTVTFTNTMKTVSLTVSKMVDDVTIEDLKNTDSFTFRLSYKKADDSFAAASNQSYEVGDETFATDEEGKFALNDGQTASFTGLPYGEYKVEEIGTENNGRAVLDSTTLGKVWTTKVNGTDGTEDSEAATMEDQTLDFTFENTRKLVDGTGKLKAVKVWKGDVANGGTIEVILERTTGNWAMAKEMAPIKVEGMISATNTFQITDLPAYDLNGAKYTYRIKGETPINGYETVISTDHKTITNTQDTTLVIRKTGTVDSVASTNDQFTIALGGAEGTFSTEKTNPTVYTIGAETTYTVDGLKDYTITETSLNGYYVKNITVEAMDSNDAIVADYGAVTVAEAKAVLDDIPAGGTVTVTIENAPQLGAVEIHKTKPSGQPLSGATFSLYTDEACTTEYDTDTTDTDGAITFDSLPIGTYYMKEDSAPTGFDKVDIVWTVEVTANPVVDSQYALVEVTAEGASAISGVNGTATVSVTDPYKDGNSLVITKTVDDSAIEKYNGVFKFKVTLTHDSHSSFDVEMNGETETFTRGNSVTLTATCEDGVWKNNTLSKMPYGTKVVVEEIFEGTTTEAKVWNTSWAITGADAAAQGQTTKAEFTFNAEKEQNVTVAFANERKAQTSLTATKSWTDRRDEYGLRAAATEYSFQLQQKAEDDEAFADVTGEAYTVAFTPVAKADGDDQLVATWTYLPVYTADGKAITYKVVELGDNANYTEGASVPATVTPADKTPATVTITNDLVDDKEVTVYKKWNDKGYSVTDENAVLFHPDLTFELKHKGVGQNEAAAHEKDTVTYADFVASEVEGVDKQHTFKNLPADASNTYSLVETIEATYGENKTAYPFYYTQNTTVDAENGFTVTNTLETRDIELTKKWQDNGIAAITRPGVTFKLYYRAIRSADKIELGSWTIAERAFTEDTYSENRVLVDKYIFQNLPKLMAGYEYVITEATEYSAEAENKYYEAFAEKEVWRSGEVATDTGDLKPEVTNTAEYGAFRIQKNVQMNGSSWSLSDGETFPFGYVYAGTDGDIDRKVSIDVELQNKATTGITDEIILPIGTEVTVSEELTTALAAEWKPVGETEKEITISATSYKTPVIITNERNLTSVSVTKQWEDFGGAVKDRPTVTFGLFLKDDDDDVPVLDANGEPMTWTPETGAQNVAQTHTWNNVPVHAGGYVVKEIVDDDSNFGLYVPVAPVVNGGDETCYTEASKATVDQTAELTWTNGKLPTALFKNERTMSEVTITKQIVDTTIDSENGMDQKFNFEAIQNISVGGGTVIAMNKPQKVNGKLLGDEADAYIGDDEYVTFYLKIGEIYTLTENAAAFEGDVNNVWNTSWSYDNGFSTAEGTFVPQNAALNITVTNERIPTTISVEKTWVDDSNAASTRPTEIVVNAYQNDEALMQTVVPASEDVEQTNISDTLAVVADDTHTYTKVFEDDNLPKAAVNGVDYIYTAKEVVDENGKFVGAANNISAAEDDTYLYTVTYDYLTNGVTKVTNALDADTIELAFTKHWKDGSNQTGIRPAAATYATGTVAEGSEVKWLDLYRKAANETVWTPVTGAMISAAQSGDDDYNVTITGIERFNGGYQYQYAIVENLPADTEYVLTGADETIKTAAGELKAIVFSVTGDKLNQPAITNTLTNNVTVTVNKVWLDGDGELAVIPDQATIELHQNGSKIDKQTLSRGNEWTITWPVVSEDEATVKLPKYDADGKLYIYTVKEAGMKSESTGEGETAVTTEYVEIKGVRYNVTIEDPVIDDVTAKEETAYSATVTNLRPNDDPEDFEKKHEETDVQWTAIDNGETRTGSGLRLGDQLTYTISWHNHLNTPATLTVTDVLPEELRFVSGTDTDADAETDEVPANAPAITAEPAYTEATQGGGSVVWTIKAEPFAKGVITVTVELVAIPEGSDPDATNTASLVINGETQDVDEDIVDISNPAIDVEKTEIRERPEGGYAVGDTVEYKVVVTNTGDVVLKNITVKDTRVDLTKIDAEVLTEGVIAELKVGESVEFTYTYVLTEADLRNVTVGSDEATGEAVNEYHLFDNTVSVSADDPTDAPDGDGNVTDEDTVKVPMVEEAPSLTITKTITNRDSEDYEYALNDVIEYSVTVTNDGNVTLKNIELADTLVADLDGNAMIIDELAPGASVTFTYDYVVTEEDIRFVAGEDDVRETNTVYNEVSATYTYAPIVGESITETVSDDETAQLKDPSQDLKITKLAVDKAEGTADYYTEGETVVYNIIVENTGNLTLKNVKVTDTLLNAAGADAADLQASEDGSYRIETIDGVKTAVIDTLLPADDPATETVEADKVIITATYTVLNADLGDKTLNNKAFVKAEDRDDPEKTIEDNDDVDVTTGPTTDHVVTKVWKETSIENVRPAKITVQLVQWMNGERVKVYDTMDLTAEDAADANTWTHKWTGLPAHDADHNEFSYTVEEIAIGKHSVKAEGDVKSAHGYIVTEATAAQEGAVSTKANVAGDETTVTNDQQVTFVDVKKVWLTGDAENNELRDDLRQDITVDLYLNNDTETVFRTVDLDAADALWSASFERLPVFTAEGDECSYTVKETIHAMTDETGAAILDGEFVTEITGSDEDGYTITNTRKDEDEVIPTKTQTAATKEFEVLDENGNVVDMVKTGGTITYTIDYYNNTNITSVIKLVDKLDEKVTFAATSAAEDQYTYDAATNTVTWTIAGVEPFTGGSLTLTVKVNDDAADDDTVQHPIVTNTVKQLTNDVEQSGSSEPVDTEIYNEKYSVVKTLINKPANGEKFALGETAKFEITVKNLGNTEIPEITITETLEGAYFVNEDGTTSTTAVVENLAIGATVVLKAEYTIVESDLGNDDLANTLTAQAKDPTDPEKPVDPDDPIDPVPIPVVDPKPAYTVVKKLVNEPANGEKFALGETAKFEITVTNTGNIKLDKITVKEELAGAIFANGADTAVVENLAVGASVVLKAEYTIIESDLGNDELANTLSAKGEYTDPNPDPDEDPKKPVDPDPIVPVPIPVVDPKPAYTVVKKLVNEPANGEKFALGETAKFEITVTNTGNIKLDKITVKEELAGAIFANGTDTAVVENLAVGASVVLKAEYTVIESDLGNDELANTLSAKGEYTDPNPDPDEDPKKPVDPDPIVPEPIPVVDPKPAYTVVKKLVNEPANGEKFALGETAKFEITVTNTGNIKLDKITVKEELEGAIFANGTDTAVVENLAVGASVVLKAEYTITESDLGNDELANTLSAKGEYTDPNPDPDEDPKKPVDPDPIDPEPIPVVDPKPAYTVVKKLVNLPERGYFVLGETAEFEITVTNTGNVTLDEIVITEMLAGATFADGTTEAVVKDLAPSINGSTDNVVVLNAQYTVTEADLGNEALANTLSAKGEYTDPNPDPDEDPKKPVDPDPIVPVPIPVVDPKPSYTVVKTLTNLPERGYFVLGETAEFEITVTNTGNVTLDEIVITEMLAGATFADGTTEAVVKGLAPSINGSTDNVVVLKAQYTVTEADLGNEALANTLSAKGEYTDPNPDPGEDPEKPADPDPIVPTPIPVDDVTTVTASKVWDDQENKFGTRTESVNVSLLADGKVWKTATLSEANGWKVTFGQLPVHNADASVIAYTVVEDAVTGYDTSYEVDETGSNVTITNTLQQYTLTVNYWYGQVGGSVAAETFTRTYSYGESYNVTSPNITGYSVDKANVAGVITGDAQFDVIYTAINYNLTVYYVYGDGTTAAATYRDTLNIDDRYSVTSPALEGYVASTRLVSGTMPGRNLVYTVIYVPDTVVIDEYGTPLNIGSVVMNVGDCFE